MRVVREKELQFLKREIRYLVDSKVLPAEKSNEIEVLYVGRNQFPFTQTLLYVGAVLIGARILSFIASNWEEIDRVYKLVLIIGIYLGCNFAGFKLEQYYIEDSEKFLLSRSDGFRCWNLSG